jgi:hypothetical protein
MARAATRRGGGANAGGGRRAPPETRVGAAGGPASGCRAALTTTSRGRSGRRRKRRGWRQRRRGVSDGSGGGVADAVAAQSPVRHRLRRRAVVEYVAAFTHDVVTAFTGQAASAAPRGARVECGVHGLGGRRRAARCVRGRVAPPSCACVWAKRRSEITRLSSLGSPNTSWCLFPRTLPSPRRCTGGREPECVSC